MPGAGGQVGVRTATPVVGIKPYEHLLYLMCAASCRQHPHTRSEAAKL